jgi:hypothetical protein
MESYITAATKTRAKQKNSLMRAKEDEKNAFHVKH